MDFFSISKKEKKSAADSLHGLLRPPLFNLTSVSTLIFSCPEDQVLINRSPMRETMKVIDRKLAREARKGARGITAAQMAQNMRVDPSLFSRWRKNENSAGVNRDTLVSMQIGFSDDPLEQAELLAAYLRDQRHGPASRLVRVIVPPGRRTKT